jgi:ribosomal-protein-alanine N-acetyltransferase
MQLECPRLLLRPWRIGDESALVHHANNRNIWRNLRDRFPNPYTLHHAVQWIRLVEAQGEPPTSFAIVLDSEPIGGIGIERFADVNRNVAEIGYWLSQEHWGKGYATEAVQRITRYAFETFDLERLEAGVFEWNPASCRVLEKAGYRFEARLRRSVVKDGQTIDRLIYARFRDGAAVASER